MTQTEDILGLRLHSYPSIYNLGHTAVSTILDGPVLVEEKVDGSQFSFGVIEGELCCRSKGKQIVLSAPEKMFERAVSVIEERAHGLTEGWVYRGEYLQKPKHNTLQYERIPDDFLVIFDICPGLEEYLSPAEKREEATRIGFETVPVFYEGMVETFDQLKELLTTQSFLGGTTVEGVVIKRYDVFTKDKKAMMAKYVSEAFKERHSKEWKKANPGTGDVIQQLTVELRTEARWQKAVQHLRDGGTLDGSPKDIGPLMKEVGQDVLKEEHEHIAEALFKYAWPKIQRGLTAGLPQWYKDELAKQAFDAEV